MQNKFLSLLGMARKANRVSLGYDKALDAVHSGNSHAVFLASDLSQKTKRGLVFAAEEYEIPVISTEFSIFEITNAVGTKTGVVSVNDAGFVKKLLTLI
ncbi:MAG: ribosomal L7Ae/L30e/S12e/Gadd45 family protein [Clostridia bacterium]|nr:ribosomal L7Ae/L30e/S12e/Gadd45 family protein [Clostridia bacterium]